MYNSTEFLQQAEAVNFKSVLNGYCREFSNWSRYEGIPKYDPVLAKHIQSTNYTTFLRFDFTSIGAEVFAPLVYFSEGGVHAFGLPIVERNCDLDEIKEIDPLRFVELAAMFAKNKYPNANAEYTKERLKNSINNLAVFLANHKSNNRQVNSPEQSFIESEQSLILGHSVHPLPKSREGFTEDELVLYSPETRGQFQLHYFLIHPDNVVEKSSEQGLITDQIKKEVLSHIEDDNINEILAKYPDWKIVPTHPWEASYLLNQTDVQNMQSEKVLFSLGQFGPLFTATSSVRTVYNADSKWMFKFSLHVKITNSFRVNYPHELNRGYNASQLMRTEWGDKIKKDFPEIEFICDSAFITVFFKNNIVEGFSTSVRQNPFQGAGAKKNVSLIASITQDGVLGQKSRILNIIEASSSRIGKSISETAIAWFKQYLKISIRPLVGIFNKYGLGSEFHQQNMLVEFDDNFFPKKLYFRDNQGYAFRQGKADELLKLNSDFGKEIRSFIADDRMINFWCYYLIVNHLLGLISAMGNAKLVEERVLIKLLYEVLKAEEENDTTGLVSHLINDVKLTVKGNLLTSLNNMDEASAPSTAPAVYKPFPNPLNQYFFSKKLINPDPQKTVFSRYFEKEKVMISLRPVDIDRDIEMLHEWFHREHALKIWQMNWSIKELELFYRTMLPEAHSHSYIGEANGVPSFNVEVYWASRDIVGEYYDVLQ